jgi:hypothetical protein
VRLFVGHVFSDKLIAFVLLSYFWRRLLALLKPIGGSAPTRAYHSATFYRDELFVFGGVVPQPHPQPDIVTNEVTVFNIGPLIGV